MASTKDLRAAIEHELPALLEIRHDLHAHPELKYEEQRTAGLGNPMFRKSRRRQHTTYKVSRF